MSTTNYTSQSPFILGSYIPVFDKTGILVDNKVLNETHTINSNLGTDWQVIIPLFGPFFKTNLSVSFKPDNGGSFSNLVEGIDYVLVYQFVGATRSIGKDLYGGIQILNNQLSGQVRINTYQSLGGDWVININKINTILANQIQNPKVTSWEQIAQIPTVFPVIDHEYNLQDQVGASDIVQAIEGIATSITNKPNNAEAGALAAITAHLQDATNPHPQYLTSAQLQSILSSNVFRGSYIGNLDLTGANYSLTSSTISDLNGVFSATFNQNNPINATIILPNGTAKNIVDASGNKIQKDEIVAGETRLLINTSDKVVLIAIRKFQSITLGSSSFDNVAQNDVVSFSAGALVKSNIGASTTNVNVIGIADKANNRVVYKGLMSGFTGLTVDAVYYLNQATPGGITTTKPDKNVVIVGVAKTTTDLYVSININLTHLHEISEINGLQAALIAAVPSGTIVYSASPNVPTGYFKCNGGTVSRTTYSSLLTAIGTTFGVGDGSTTFKLPDLRGLFIRVLDEGRNIDPGRTLTSTPQADQLKSHNHNANVAIASDAGGNTNFGGGNASVVGNVSVSSTGGTETRPINMALYAFIKS